MSSKKLTSSLVEVRFQQLTHFLFFSCRLSLIKLSRLVRFEIHWLFYVCNRFPATLQNYSNSLILAYSISNKFYTVPNDIHLTLLSAVVWLIGSLFDQCQGKPEQLLCERACPLLGYPQEKVCTGHAVLQSPQDWMVLQPKPCKVIYKIAKLTTTA